MYVVPAAIDGPVLLYVTLALTVLPATADAGDEMLVVTSASGETAVVSVALSGRAFAPCDIDVPTLEFAVTEPDAGAVKLKPIVIDAPGANPVGSPLNVTAPLAAS